VRELGPLEGELGADEQPRVGVQDLEHLARRDRGAVGVPEARERLVSDAPLRVDVEERLVFGPEEPAVEDGAGLGEAQLARHGAAARDRAAGGGWTTQFHRSGGITRAILRNILRESGA
jgi:hypothetical protein